MRFNAMESNIEDNFVKLSLYGCSLFDEKCNEQ